MKKVDYPYLYDLRQRLEQGTITLSVVALLPLLLTLRQSPEVKLISAGASSAIAAVASVMNRGARSTKERIEEHQGIAGVQRTKVLQDEYKDLPEVETLQQMAVRLMKAKKSPREIIEDHWGFKGSLYPDGLEHWKRLGLPEGK